jgi:hypothetical protein
MFRLWEFFPLFFLLCDVKFDVCFEVMKRTAERAGETRVMLVECTTDTLVMEGMGARSDEECLADGNRE